jgi:hypothetical protein
MIAALRQPVADQPIWAKAILVLLLVVAVALGFGLVAEPAGATTAPGVNATPFNHSSHPWTTDGCSVVADRGVWNNAYFDFHHACIHHDGCYRGRWASRETCDAWFLNDMNASCNALHSWWSPQRNGCKSTAYQYYLGVRLFGGSAYAYASYYIPMNGYVPTNHYA